MNENNPSDGYKLIDSLSVKKYEPNFVKVVESVLPESIIRKIQESQFYRLLYEGNDEPLYERKY